MNFIKKKLKSLELENKLKSNNKKNEEQYIVSQDLENKLELNNK